ncbi:hypothetical protein [Gulosibacter sp. 10]|uniref:hypothetical protein n=1 Tax=Gulosibacter sp. 10 TaxID=1255570 RepID=UPI00097ECA0E|nr:hypothetical protein [Gulosibacter sp. 10]SJM67228.1 hypothetical protein FM112_12360 [Gulosibacter sp. 10]
MLLWLMRTGFTIALLVLSVVGFLSLVGAERWHPKQDADVACDPVRVEGPGGEIRFVGSSCDDGTYYLSTATGGTDWTREVTEEEFALRHIVASELDEGWRNDIALDEPHVQELLVELGYETPE